MFNKKKILICIEALEMNGVMRSLLDFLKVLSREKYEISLFCFDKDDGFMHLLPDDITILPEIWEYKLARCPFKRGATQALRAGRLGVVLKRLVYVALGRISSRFSKWQMLQNAPRVPGEYDLACAYSLGATWQVVATKVTATSKFAWLHTDYRFLPAIWEQYRGYLDPMTALFCVCKGVRDLVQANYAELHDKVMTVHNVVDMSRIRLRAREACAVPPRRAPLRLVTIGRYSPPKAQDIIALVASRILAAGIDFEWFVAGPGLSLSEKELVRQTREQGVEGRVHWMDALSNPYPLMASADIYVQPSRWEGWGLTLSEALVLGRYVVATNIPAHKEQFTDVHYGELVPFDADALAQAILAGAEKRAYMHDVEPYVSPYSVEFVRREFEGHIQGDR